MLSGLHIEDHKNLTKKKKVLSYLEPNYVYIPLVNQNDTNITVLVKKGDYVQKGTIIGKRKGNLRISIHSSVSGTVVDFVEKPYLNGQMVKCVKIENDKKETPIDPVETKKISQYTKEEFVRILKNSGVIGMGGNGFPTYVKYDHDLPLQTLLINATECEPYITSDYALMTTHLEEILEVMDAIMEIYHMKEAIIAVKKSNQKLYKYIHNYIGTYLKMKVVMVSDKYGIGWERMLVHEVKHVSYQKYPLEKGIVVNNVSTMYAIYQALHGIPLTERIVTFTGEMLKEPQNVLVKVGTPTSEVIEFLGGYKRNTDLRFIAGGPMMGTSLPNDELVVSPNLNCVLVLKDWKKVEEHPCMRCGKCISVCPAKLSPVLIKDYQKNKRRLEELKPEKCMECGLCDYICPSGIPLREIIKKVKEGLK